MTIPSIDITEALCENVVDTRFENLDEAIVNNAKNRIIEFFHYSTIN